MAEAAAAVAAPMAGDSGTSNPANGAPSTPGSGAGAAGAAGAAAPAKAAPPKLYAVKVDGQTVQMTEQDLLQYASLGRAGHSRMEQANQLKSQVEGFLTKFKQDPMAALRDPALGLSPQQIRQLIEADYKKNYIDQDKLSPEQKELQEAKARIKQFEDEKAANQKKFQEAQQAQLQKHWHDSYEAQIIDALEKSGLEKDPYTVARMAFYMQQSARNKYDAPMEMIVNQVKEEEQRRWAKQAQLPVEKLVEWLGPDVIKKIQKYSLLKHKEKLSAGFEPKTPETTSSRGKEKRADSKEGWNKVKSYWTRHDR